ncbi:hypothetical protein B1F69_04505 [Pseudomonas syringae]|nr:hypothetical protein B1F69_04505 [Pseudomonas syringae]
MAQRIECPECRGPLKVRIDIDADISFRVSRTGQLSKREVRDNQQSDGRCGLECQDCRWQVHGNDVQDDALLKVIQNADEQWHGLQLSLVRAKP